MSKLLLDEHPLLILPRLATAIGLKQAVVLQQIHYWVGLFQKANDPKHFKEGYWWVWNTGPEWRTNFPFWSERTVWRVLESLRQPYERKNDNDKSLPRGPLIITGCFNPAGYDRTLWYRIDYAEIDKLEKSILTNWQDGSGQSGNIHLDNMTLPIPETTTETIPESTTEIPEKTGDDLLDQFFGARPERQPTECKGNAAVPVQAGGGHSPAHKLVDGICRYNGLTQGAESLPEKKRASWIKHIAEIIEQWGGATVEQAHLAWQAWVVDYAWKGAANPFYSTFETEIGPLLVGVREGSITLETLKAKAHEANGGGAHAGNKPNRKGRTEKGQWSAEEIAAANQRAADELGEAT